MSQAWESTLSVTLLPRDTNRLGTIFGGVILSHVDLAAAVEARRVGGNLNFVTVAFDKVVFLAPVFVGDILHLYTETIRKGWTSVTVKVIVEAERIEDLSVVRVTEAEVVMVAVDDDRRPVPIQAQSRKPT